MQGNDLSIIQGFLEGIRPNIAQNVSEWADENVWLTSDIAAEPGKYYSSRTPYMVEIMDSVSPNSSVQETYFMKGVQIAGTQGALNVFGCFAAINPRPIMYVMPTIQTAREFSKTKLKSFIENCGPLRDRVSSQKERDGDNTILLKEFLGGYIKLCGANSASSLRSNTIGLLILDEVDAYPGNVDGEGSPISLAEKRLTTFGESGKKYVLSTPLIKNNSYIESNYILTDQRKYFIPCPFCGFKQHLEFKNLKWEVGDYKNVSYECQECLKLIEERYKTAFMSKEAGAEWIPTNEKGLSLTRRGYHLNSLYSPLGWLSWNKIAKDYDEKAVKDVNEMRVFINTILAETFEETGEKINPSELYKRRESYKFNVVPSNVAFLTCGVDVQKNRIELEIVGWCKNKESYSIDYRVLPGTTDSSEVWDALALIVNEVWKREDGSTMPLKLMCVDSGYNQSMVYAFCARFGGSTVVPIKGQDKQRTILKAPSAVNYSQGGKVIGEVRLWNVGSSVLKAEIYGFLKQTIVDGVVPYGYCHFPEYDEEHFKRLTAEELKMAVDKNGQQVNAWVLPSGARNEQLDCRNYARAAAEIVGISVFSLDDFDSLINSYGKTYVKPSNKIKPNDFWDK